MKFLIALALSFSAHAGGARNIPQIGEHYPIIIVEKDVNPQNIMVVYTKLGRQCEMQLEDQEPNFNFYWLMDRKSYKPVNSIIESNIRGRLELEAAQGGAQRDTFFVKVNDLKEMDHDLKNPKLTVKSRLENGKCFVESFMQLGPSNGNVMIRLDSIFTEGGSLFHPTPDQVTLKGVNLKTGAAVSRTYKAK